MDQEFYEKEDLNCNIGNNNNNNNIKHISYVPDYRVMQIIDEQTKNLNKILMNCDPIIRSISKSDDFKSFRLSLHDVQKYLKQNSLTSINSLEQNSSIELIKEIKQLFPSGSGSISNNNNSSSSSLLSTDEIVMLLNQMPNNESMVELLFPGKFSKEHTQQLLQLIQKYTKQTSENVENVESTDNPGSELPQEQIINNNNVKDEPIKSNNQMEIESGDHDPQLQQQIRIKSED